MVASYGNGDYLLRLWDREILISFQCDSMSSNRASLTSSSFGSERLVQPILGDLEL